MDKKHSTKTLKKHRIAKALFSFLQLISTNSEKLILAGVLICFTVIGTFIVRDSLSRASIAWMGIFDINKFVHISFVELVNFYKELRVSIPPIIGLFEILSIRFTGSTALVTVYAYRVSLVACYLIAITLASTSTKRLILSFFTSLVFLYATVIIHPGNSLDYDIFLPLFFLAYVMLLKKTVNSPNKNSKFFWLLPFFSGLFLSMAELSRPFVIYIMPLLVAFTYFSFKKCCAKKHFIAFIIPIILFSGIWHWHLYTAHKQVSFSNHSGFNLARAWMQAPVDWVTKQGWGGRAAESWIQIHPENMVTEIHSAPLFDGGSKNLNTKEHTENSQRLQSMIFKYWLSNPNDSFFYALDRINVLLSAETSIYNHKPHRRWFGLYKLLVKVTSSLVLINFGTLLFGIVKNRFRLRSFLSLSDILILFFATYSIIVLSISEAGEEARFLISILPFLAVLPSPYAKITNSKTTHLIQENFTEVV